MSGTVAIWDFNGTILDDVQTGIDSINLLLTRRGLPTIDSVADYYKKFRFPIIDYYAQLGFDFTKEDFSVVAVEWVREYDRLVPRAGLRPGVREAIDLLSRAGIKQIVLSATEQNMLERQIDGLGLRGLFYALLGMDNVEAHTKLPAARRFMESERPPRAVMIGDTSHDAEVARTVGADCILVAGGHQSRDTLLSCRVPVCCDPVAAARMIIDTDK